MTSTTSATEQLAIVLTTALQRGESWPCKDDHNWTAEEHQRRALAARLCRPCPVSALCDAAAREWRPSFGVFAGIDWTDLNNRPKKEKTS